MNVEPNPILPIFQRNGWVSLNRIVEKKNIERKGGKKKRTGWWWLNANWENSKGTSKG